MEGWGYHPIDRNIYLNKPLEIKSSTSLSGTNFVKVKHIKNQRKISNFIFNHELLNEHVLSNLFPQKYKRPIR